MVLAANIFFFNYQNIGIQTIETKFLKLSDYQNSE
jgi:hypothetical protein